MRQATESYQQAYGYDLFKGVPKLSQVLKQAEIDAMGLTMVDGGFSVQALDVAFHEGGLIYANKRQDTANKVAMKILRTAMCLYGYFGASEGEISFASPKIGKLLKADIDVRVQHVQKLFIDSGLSFGVRVYANEDFKNEVPLPLLSISKEVADTSEFFMRSCQLCEMFKLVNGDHENNRRLTSIKNRSRFE